MTGAPHFSLERSLGGAGASTLSHVIEQIARGQRVDLAAPPLGALAFLLSRARRSLGKPMLLLCADTGDASRLASDLRFFARHEGTTDQAASERVLLYPGAEATPFVDVAPDRRAAMDRLAVLFHLAHGLPFGFLIAALPAVARRVPPRDAIRAHSQLVSVGGELQREPFLRMLAEGGYLRVPLVEDPGTFAVRGGLIDVFPPHEREPSRIELDDDLVMSIRRFDPDDQRTLGDANEVRIHPVREALVGPEELARAKERVADLCDSLNMPTIRRRQLVEEIGQGRAFLGIEGFLPAFYETLDTLFDYLPKDTHVCAFDPRALELALEDELQRADYDRSAKVEAKAPVFALDSLYMRASDVLARVESSAPTVVHALAIGGAPDRESEDASERAVGTLSHVDPERVLRIAALDHSLLAAELKARRATRKGDEPLTPLVGYLNRFQEEGVRVLLSVKTTTQAERLGSLLRGYGLSIGKPEPQAPDALNELSSERAHLCVGSLEDGFVIPSEALAVITEREIFGERSQRRTQRKKQRDRARAFVEDLRELRTGDYVVHSEHGIGRYLGLDYKEVPVSRFEQLQGITPKRVEVLVIEYQAGDKLYVPVTRLSQIEKFGSADAAAPKLDKLGGQTFERTKARVRSDVRKLADDLLALYAARKARTRPDYPPLGREYTEFEATFSFEETDDQARAIEDVMGDLDGKQPMDRLVCGDVGFGKTEVAIRAAFRVAMAGRQVAVMCPTTVLAQQHFLTFEERMRDYPIRVAVLSRFVDKKEQAAVVARLKAGEIDIVIGTHRLLSKDVHFKDLGLLVVDEEQRFGVAHKERVKQLKNEVDVLTLSATPIPRTLQLAVTGLRELSIIATPPTNRRAVRTSVTRWDDHVLREALKRELSRGGQIFFVHNRIERLHERAAQLAELIPDARIAVAHGRLREATLEHVMTDFVAGQYDILCCTAIVENGLDIPRANTILVDRADTFGLSQLYQLRGRVGRSRERAYCYLIAPPESQLSDEARARIEALQRFSQLGSGFQIASLDMELRGAGDLLGAEQSGNVAAVGLEMFVQMLDEAVHELRGEPVVHAIDPELTLDLEHYLPDDYVSDVGLRLSLYKRFASADDEDAVNDIAAEMEDRFGPPPAAALAFVRAMALKPALRALRALGCEATASRVTLHLRADTPLDGARVAQLVAKNKAFQITPDLRLTRRFQTAADGGGDAIDHVQKLLGELAPLRND
ncbi:MAG TPA: transcription-repair coupling factor [Polyangiales bacterium]|nr:transcription-repair coupling factor [Polyangiales bacterium]